MNAIEPVLFAIKRLAVRWDVSPFQVRRLIASGDLKSVNVGARVLVPISEIQRAEQYGVGKCRKSRGV